MNEERQTIILPSKVSSIFEVVLEGACPLVPGAVFDTGDWESFVCEITGPNGFSAAAEVTAKDLTTMTVKLGYEAATFPGTVDRTRKYSADIVATHKTLGEPGRLFAFCVQFDPTVSTPVIAEA